MSALGKEGSVKLEVGAVDACAEVGLVEMLSLALRDFVADWSMQPACVARADAGQKNGSGVARSPSWGILGQIESKKV